MVAVIKPSTHKGKISEITPAVKICADGCIM
mgnify:CR=1 FL=1